MSLPNLHNCKPHNNTSIIHTNSIENGKYKFDDEEAIRLLNKCLLKKDFDLDVNIPVGNLCPTVANRLDYLHLIEDLLLISRIDVDMGPVCGYDMYHK